jgi:exodeoxyribonuclease VIII
VEKYKYDDGVFEITNDEYHSSAGLSRSALMKFRKSPYHYWYQYLSGEASHVEPTPALVFGELVHTLALEPHEADNRFVMAPSVDRRTKQGKLVWQAFMGSVESQGLQIVKEEDLVLAKKMAGRVRDNTLVDSMLEDASVEFSIYFTHATTGIQCKVRPDIWNGGIVADLKTTADASYRAFQSSAYKYGYFLQAGMMQEALYSIGIDLEKFIFIPVEKEEPHAVGLYILDDEAISYGVKLFDDLMERVARCQEKNNWESYGIQNLCVPGYAKFDELLEVE